jgi:hypothetical protein
MREPSGSNDLEAMLRPGACERLLRGVPYARLTESDPAVCMFVAYLKGDHTAALAFADEIQATANRGLIRLEDGLFVEPEQQIGIDVWRRVSAWEVWTVVRGLLGAKYHRANRPIAHQTLSFAEMTAYTEARLGRLYNVGPVRVRQFRGWLRGFGLKLADA